MYVLGINCAYHESSACLIKKGELIAFAEEERFTRRKHAKRALVDNADQLPESAIRFCLNHAATDWNEIEHVGFSLDPDERIRRTLAHDHGYQPTAGSFGTEAGEDRFYRGVLSIETKLRELGFRGTFHLLDHHDCHAASAFYVSGFDQAAVVVVDGIGEHEASSVYLGEDTKLSRIHEVAFPNSLGFLWEKIAELLGFSDNDAAKVMGLASYGDPSPYRELFKKFAAEGRNHPVDDSVTKFRTKSYADLEQILGVHKRNAPVEELSAETQAYADIAATLQELTEISLVDLARIGVEKGLSRMCLAGGVGLNCCANGHLLSSQMFEDVFIMPAAHDAGTALGAAYLIWHQLLGKPRSFVFESPYWGPSFTDDQIQEEIGRTGLCFDKDEDIARTAAALIAKGNVVGWFQGRMEIGPRALGNRSILADPRDENVREILNRKVKHREPFRPFCPSVLEECAEQWFEIDGSARSPARYMLATYKAREEQAARIPAVVHVDGTSRIQLVSKNRNDRFHSLIAEFAELTGVPMVLNTSFNDAEPIVCTPRDALNTFLSTDIDYLIAGTCILSKKENCANAKVR